jgi:hypothetical protein
MTVPSSRLTAPAPGFRRQNGLGAVARLDLAVFVERQHLGMGGRIDVETTILASLTGKLASRERLKLSERWRCSLWSRRMRCTALSETPVPWSSPCRFQGLPGVASPSKSALAPTPWFPRRLGHRRVCGSCRAADLQSRSRQSVVAIATRLVG